MKKILLASAVMAGFAAMAGSICDPDVAVELGCRAYDFQASVKLVDGKNGTIKATSICSADDVNWYRVAATRKIKGVFTDCNVCQSTNGTINPAQSSFFVGEQAGGAVLYVSTSATKYKQVFNSEIYNGQPTDDYWFNVLNVFGGNTWDKSKKLESLFQIEFVERDQYNEERAYWLLCAGFGTRDGAVIKSLSGTLAGAVTAANWCGLATQVWEPCLKTPYWTPGSGSPTPKDNWANGTGTTWTSTQASTVTADKSPTYDAVSGTWSLKYNASKSKLQTNSALMKKTFASDYTFFGPITGTPAVYPVAAPVVLQ